MRYLSAIAVFCFLGLTLAGCGSKEDVPVEELRPEPVSETAAPDRTGSGRVIQPNENTVNKIAAVVNGEMITLHELRGHTAGELMRMRLRSDDPRVESVQRQVLESMINEILMRQEAKRFKVSVSEAEVRDELNLAVKRSGLPQDQFEAKLKKDGITMDMYKERVGNTLLRQRMAGFMVMRKVFVTPEEIAAYYAKNKAEFAGEATADFSLLILPESVNAQGIYKQLQSGAVKFEDVAREHSVDASKSDGGRITGVPWERLMPEMKKILTPLKDGQYAPVLRTRGGYVIIRRDAVHEAKALTLQEATPKIEEILRAPLLEERFKEWITQLRGKAVIDIRI